MVGGKKTTRYWRYAYVARKRQLAELQEAEGKCQGARTGLLAIFKMHIFPGMSVFLFFPLTRLVHIWSAPVGYLFRADQIVRAKRPT
jgi:nitrate reductase gamma subunit